MFHSWNEKPFGRPGFPPVTSSKTRNPEIGGHAGGFKPARGPGPAGEGRNPVKTGATLSDRRHGPRPCQINQRLGGIPGAARTARRSRGHDGPEPTRPGGSPHVPLDGVLLLGMTSGWMLFIRPSRPTGAPATRPTGPPHPVAGGQGPGGERHACGRSHLGPGRSWSLALPRPRSRHPVARPCGTPVALPRPAFRGVLVAGVRWTRPVRLASPFRDLSTSRSRICRPRRCRRG